MLYNNVATIYNEHIKTRNVSSLNKKQVNKMTYAQAFQENFEANYEGKEMAVLEVTAMWYEHSIDGDDVNMLYVLRDTKGNELKSEVKPRKVYAWQQASARYV